MSEASRRAKRASIRRRKNKKEKHGEQNTGFNTGIRRGKHGEIRQQTRKTSRKNTGNPPSKAGREIRDSTRKNNPPDAKLGEKSLAKSTRRKAGPENPEKKNTKTKTTKRPETVWGRFGGFLGRSGFSRGRGWWRHVQLYRKALPRAPGSPREAPKRSPKISEERVRHFFASPSVSDEKSIFFSLHLVLLTKNPVIFRFT